MSNKRIVAEYEGGEFVIGIKSDQTVTSLTPTRFVVMEKNSHNEDTIVQVFNADVFKIEECCGGQAVGAMCACK